MQYYHNLAVFFDSIVATQPYAVALRYGEKEYSYAELYDYVTLAAKALKDSGLRHGDVIALAHEKSVFSYAMMLAALRSGVAYVNIDIYSPAARLAKILTVAQPKVLFYDESGVSTAVQEVTALVRIPSYLLSEDFLCGQRSPHIQEETSAPLSIDGATIAYIMFTSGSTGTPKGVAVTHENLMHFINWVQVEFLVSVDSVFTNLNPMYFDNSVFDFYGALFSGATLVPVKRNLLTSPYELVEYVSSQKCSIWFSVPSMLIYLVTMKALKASSLPSMKHVVFGGEGYPKVELQKLYSFFSSRAGLVNVYGPTECTCICSAYRISAKDFDDVSGLPPLGVLNVNFDHRIVDENGCDANAGELVLIGPNVAAGYFNDVSQTERAFETIRTTDRFGKRAYRTGDLVRRDEGLLYFVGRKDNQIKHMGYRIELEEIEHGLMAVPGVSQAAVVYHREGATHGRLYGFVATSAEISESLVLAELAKHVPSYMVPHKVTVCASLPKNSNGKVDRRQLLDGIGREK